jgi:hypothetical protein
VEEIEGSTLTVRFVRPRREDEVVIAGGAPAAQGSGFYDVYARNQRAENVVEGRWMPSASRGSIESSAAW